MDLFKKVVRWERLKFYNIFIYKYLQSNKKILVYLAQQSRLVPGVRRRWRAESRPAQSTGGLPEGSSFHPFPLCYWRS